MKSCRYARGFHFPSSAGPETYTVQLACKNPKNDGKNFISIW